jgi:hypothetical protein
VLKTEPEWRALPARTPAKVQDLLRRCLVKDRDQRLSDIADARKDIEEALLVPAVAERAAPAKTHSARGQLFPAGRTEMKSETFRFMVGNFSCIAIQDDAPLYPVGMFLTNLAKEQYEPELLQQGEDHSPFVGMASSRRSRVMIPGSFR